LLRLFRAVSPAELADIAGCGILRAGPNSLMGKWFAESAADASRWGQALYPQGGFQVVQLDIPLDIADQMFCLKILDQIGPARYAEGVILALINLHHQGISEVP
jgi:hypothetical protein